MSPTATRQTTGEPEIRASYESDEGTRRLAPSASTAGWP
jgi:hypothetical protein